MEKFKDSGAESTVPTTSCAAFRDGQYDPALTFNNIIRDVRKIITDPQAEANYADLAEQYLRAAVFHADAGDSAGTKLLLDGNPAYKSLTDLAGQPKGEPYEGAKDALALARKYGADSAHLAAVDRCVTDLDAWLKKP